MPHLRFRSVTESQMQKISQSLAQELAQTLSSSEDTFTLELISSTFFKQGQPTTSYPFVEVLWFARSQELQDRCAKVITDTVHEATQAEYIDVVFQELSKSAYYENGEHF